MRKKSVRFKKTKKRVFNKYIFYTIIIIIALFAAIYFLLFYTSACEDKVCFDNAIDNCKKVSLVKSDERAIWKYEILGYGEKGCSVGVRLIQLKQGQVDIQKLEGNEMICDYVKAESYPEEDISVCSGKLKEEIQDMIIKRLHDYLLKNLGEIQESFSAI